MPQPLSSDTNFENRLVILRAHKAQNGTVRSGKFMSDVQSESETVRLAIVRLVTPEEALKQAWLDFSRDGRPRIRHGEDRLPVHALQSQANPATGAVVLDRIAQQILENLPQKRSICVNENIRIELTLEREFRRFAENFSVLDEATEIGTEIVNIWIGRQATRIRLSQQQQALRLN